MNRLNAARAAVGPPRRSCAALAAATSSGSSTNTTVNRLPLARASASAAFNAARDAFEKSTPQTIDSRVITPPQLLDGFHPQQRRASRQQHEPDVAGVERGHFEQTPKRRNVENRRKRDEGSHAE